MNKVLALCLSVMTDAVKLTLPLETLSSLFYGPALSPSNFLPLG